MTFEEYFKLEGKPEREQLIRFIVGLSPAMLGMPYLVDKSRVDFNAKKGPSTPMACDLCAGLAVHSIGKRYQPSARYQHVLQWSARQQP